MARKRDIIIAVIIGASFFITILFFFLIMLGSLTDSGEISLGGYGSKVAVVDVFGTISESEDIVRQLKKWGESKSVRAIILHVDSPGGGIAASQEIYGEIKRIREEEGKIVIAAMSSVAASGGYYISCAADKIMANPGTITGSIGVIIQFPTAGELMEKIGIAFETIKSGEVKDVGSLNRRMTDRERQMLTAMVMDSYEQFVEAVAENRDMAKEDVYGLADGSVYSGRQALMMGLVDTLGSFEDAIRMAADMAGIQGEPETVKEIKHKEGLFDLLGKLNTKMDQVLLGRNSGPEVLYLY